MGKPAKFERCQQDPSSGDLWIGHLDTFSGRQDFVALALLTMAQEDYWQRHQLLAEQMKEASRLRVGGSLLGACIRALDGIQELNDKWGSATQARKSDVAQFTLTNFALSKLVRRVLPPPPSIEERMPPHFRSVQPLQAGIVQSDTFLKGYTSAMPEFFPDPDEQIGARLHLRRGYVPPYFEHGIPESGPGSEGWYESSGLFVQRQPSMPHPDNLELLASQKVTMDTPNMEMLTPYMKYDGRGLDSHLL